jgi:2'-5' RNA ligase
MTRTFVAVEMPSAAVAALTAATTPLRERHTGLRWVRASRWHLTLAFLGEVSIGGRLRALHALWHAARSAAPFEVLLPGRLGRFGERVLWAAVETDDDALVALVATIRQELASVDLPYDDRPFRAHVTLARGRPPTTLPRTRTLTAPGLPYRWPVTAIALMSSDPDGRGNGYRTVATWPLAGEAPGA